MGQTLSEPVTAKETASCSSEWLRVGSSCMQGWRINMEDAHTQLLACPDDKDACFFGVYDGHGGAKVAQYSSRHLHKRILASSSYPEDMEAAMKEGFLGLDSDMTMDDEMKEELAGTTAVAAIIRNNTIHVANAGDSRCVASVAGLAEPLSWDHKPANEEEARRIIAAGGWVEFNRVNGNLALSRALGDFIFKKNPDKTAEEQIVTALPEVTSRPLTPAHEFVILACDGIWDVLSNQEVVDFCRDRIAGGMAPEMICEELLSRCLAPDCQMGGLGCDNMTALLVCLLGSPQEPISYADLGKKCGRARPPTPPSLDEDAGGEAEPDAEPEPEPPSPSPAYATPPLTPPTTTTATTNPQPQPNPDDPSQLQQPAQDNSQESNSERSS